MLQKEAGDGGGNGPGPSLGRMSRPQIIHSGHFMVSEPHADPDPDPDPDSEAGVAAVTAAAVALSPAGPVASRLPGPGSGLYVAGQVRRGSAGGKADDDDGAQQGSGVAYDFDTVNEGTCQIYRYGPRSSAALNIDASLTRLFECMTLAYSGKIVSPKWKTFKGLKLLQRDKIRLNNAIWRAWYLQYVEKRQNPVCSFVTPLECSDIDEHRKPEAVIMEGKYWKRQMGVVSREYRKWRMFFYTQVQRLMDKPACGPTQEVADAVPGVEQNSETAGGSPMELDPLHDLDALLDTIFSSRNLYGGPNLRNLAHQGNADMIQPTLTQLHPIFGEEFMDTLDPIHGSLANSSSICHGLQWFRLDSCATSTPSESFMLFLSIPTNASRKDFITTSRPQPTVQASTLLTDATALSQCDPDMSPIATNTKELPSPGDSVIPIPISLDVEPPVPLNGQQTFLPFFPTSPLRISPPPAPPILHLQPQTTLVFSVITHTGSERNSPSPSRSGGTFAVPTSAPPAKGGRGRQLQRIAPAPSSSHQPAPPSTSLTHLFTTGPAPLPLTTVTNAAQVCGTPKLPANAIPSSVSATEKSRLPVSAVAFSDTGVKSKESAEDKTFCNTQEMFKHYTAKGSRRSTFTSTDYTRRMVISSGFNTLASLVLPGSDQTSAKLSKAMLLQKSVAYVGRLQQERRQAQETAERLRSEIEELSTAIHEFQSQLPASGAPALPPQSDQASQLYEEYVRQRTLQNWRFWLFSTVIKPLFESYTRTVSTGSAKEFCQSVLSWLEQHCTLPILRPAISGSLLQLSKITSILTQPTRLPEQALQAISCPPHNKGNS